MNKARKIVLTVSEKGINGIFGIVCLYLFLCSIFSTCIMWYETETTYYMKDASVLLLIGLLFFVCLIAIKRKWLKKVTDKKQVFLSAVTIGWFVLSIFLVLGTNIEVVYDQREVYQAAVGFVSGNYTSWEQGNYLYIYPFQNSIVLLYVPFVYLFGKHTYLAVQFFNLFMLFLTYVGIYKITEKWFGKTVAFFSYIVALGFLPLTAYIKFMYGTIPGLCFAIWAIYLEIVFEKNKKWKYIVGSGICMAISIMWKNNYIIFLVALLIMLTLGAVKEKKLKLLFAPIVVSITCFFLSWSSLYIMGTVTGGETNNGIPSIAWVALGVTESSRAPGWYSGIAKELFESQNYDITVAKSDAWETINDSMKLFAEEKEYALRFFGRKVASIWNNPTFECFSIVTNGNLRGTLNYFWKDILYNGGIGNGILTIYMDILQSLFLFGNLLYLIYNRTNKKIDNLFFALIFIGGFIFHIFWEGKCQYTLPYMILLIPYAVKGFAVASYKVHTWWVEGRKLETIKTSKEAHIFGSLMVLILIIGMFNFNVLTSTVKLHGEESNYIWMCKNQDYWRQDYFTKEGNNVE